ncbi:MAG: protein-L-isoaspartate(D-aspartate) O-methyltransferase [Thermoplasmata archaeon]|nr:protein-L-isoaspartate(D-aspartate) O-methyltransferase [Thermoplasmata archaeon]
MRDVDSLVDDLVMEGVIHSPPVERAMRAVRREDFVPGRLRGSAYADHPLPIGGGQTISAPHMVAIMAEELQVEEGNSVLEIGTGSGYHAAVVSHLVGPEGRIISIERVDRLADNGRKNLIISGISNVQVIGADGSGGYPDGAPYDRIYYTCAAPKIPMRVMDQLKEGGVLLGVVGPNGGVQVLIRYRKKDGKIEDEPLMRCVFVPLMGKYGYG